MQLKNIYTLPSHLPPTEKFESIVENQSLKIERIISTGQITPVGEYYNQEQDEWVMVLQGEAILSDSEGSEIQLKAGDYLLIPAHQKHRVEYTSTNPPCIWLAIHANLQC
ncbi:MAG: cupin domain-containing protein [Cyanobacteriota bacterium]|nr:cupin domain-containing protein [Cyanobacteriota bacterium]